MTHFILSLSRLARLVLWLPFTLALVACQGEPASRTVLAQTLVISRWDHRPNDELAVGIDLDRTTHDGGSRCTEAADYAHATDPRDGIDNQYGGLLLALLMGLGDSTPVTDRVTTELEAGRSLYGIRITPPAMEGAPVGVTLLSFASTGPLPRSVAAQAESGALVATEIAAAAARPTPRGLRVAFPTTTIAIPMGAALGEREVEEIQLELSVDDDGVVRRGDFGGAVTMATVMAVAEAVSPEPISPADLVTFAQPDLRPDERGANCSAVSIGLGLSFVPVPEAAP